ncbi:MAG: glycosyl transferase [Phycisphaerae bacterium]|nr:glycosyl transferase [Phycisphaerae bacterium]
MHYFTSITANYLPKARVLAESVKRHNPDAAFYLMLADDPPGGFNLADEPFDALLGLEDLGIDNLDAWVFKHRVVELCTAVKGPAFVRIFEQAGADKVVYLDPDIVVLADLRQLAAMLDEASVVLTPHQLVPETDREAVIDNEICSLKHGVYNIGFLAIRDDAQGMRFLRWWRDRLLEFCYDDIPNGLFTDQRWVDLAPAFFDNVRILRDPTYNVATWNLTHRHVTEADDGRLVIDGEPIKFYHFSGFDSGDQAVMLGKYAPSGSPLFDLRKRYIEWLDAAGQRELGQLPSKHATFSNGEPISPESRIVYRLREDLQRAFPRPAEVVEERPCYYYWFKKTWPEEKARPSGVAAGVPTSASAAVGVLSGELQAVYRSRSYRLGRAITRPYRLVRRLLRRGP